MKKLTAIFSGDTEIDYEALAKVVANAEEFRVEQCQAARKGKTRSHRGGYRRHVAEGTTAVDTVIEHAVFGAEFSRSSAEKWLAAKGYRPTTAGPTLSGLEKQGLVRRTGPKRFAFTKEALRYQKTRSAKSA